MGLGNAGQNANSGNRGSNWKYEYDSLKALAEIVANTTSGGGAGCCPATNTLLQQIVDNTNDIEVSLGAGDITVELAGVESRLDTVIANQTNGTQHVIVDNPSAGTQNTNLTEVNTNPVNTGIGVAGTGTQRVAVSSDSSLASVTTLGTITNPLPSGTNVIGHVITDTGSTTAVTGSVTVVQPTGTNLHTVLDSGTLTSITNALPAGTNLLGKMGVDQTTPGTTNAVAIIAGQNGVAGGAGTTTATTQRMVIATDQTVIPVSLPSGTQTFTSTLATDSTGSPVVSGATSILFTTSSDFVGTINGQARFASTGYSLESSQGKVLPSIAYTVTAGSMNIDKLV